jgi:aconitate hydratase
VEGDSGAGGEVYDWPPSSYIARPPFFELPPQAAGDITRRPRAAAARRFGDHRPYFAGRFVRRGDAGGQLAASAQGVERADFNSYGARRGHHEVMMRGTFANVRIRNLMLPADADGRRPRAATRCSTASRRRSLRGGDELPRAGHASIVVAGEEYGTGSSRDWAAKGTRLLGVRAVIARSFERIHRANLVGMGVLPLQFIGDDSAPRSQLRGDERFDITGLGPDLCRCRTSRW